MTEIANTEQTAGAFSDAAPPDTASDAGSLADFTDFSVPEGVTLDAELTDEFRQAAREFGMKQAHAQHLVDMGVKLQQKIMHGQQLALAQQKSGWEASSKADPEFGGDRFNENLAIASRAVSAFATPALKQLLDSTGLGNHPDMIRAFYRAGKLIAEDSIVPGGSKPAGGEGRTLAERLYPNQS